MISIKRISNLDEVDWNTYNGFHDRSVCQTRAWLEFVQATQGAEPVVADVLDTSGTSIGCFTALITRRFGMRILGSPFPGWTTLYLGFTLPPDFPRLDAIRALVPFAFDELRCVHLELMDRWVTLDDAATLGWQHRILHNREIDLSQSEDDIWRGMSNSSARYSIRKAERAGVVVESVAPGDSEFAADYYTQLIDVFSKQGLAPTYGLDRVQALLKHLHPAGHLLALRARSADGECLATALFPGHGAMTYFWGGASLRRHQRLCPNEPLVWHAMRHWRERGAVRFDFGGGGAYKKKYGGREIEIPWLRRSKYPVLEFGRDVSRRIVDLRQRLKGRGRK